MAGPTSTGSTAEDHLTVDEGLLVTTPSSSSSGPFGRDDADPVATPTDDDALEPSEGMQDDGATADGTIARDVDPPGPPLAALMGDAMPEDDDMAAPSADDVAPTMAAGPTIDLDDWTPETASILSEPPAADTSVAVDDENRLAAVSTPDEGDGRNIGSAPTPTPSTASTEDAAVDALSSGAADATIDITTTGPDEPLGTTPDDAIGVPSGRVVAGDDAELVVDTAEAGAVDAGDVAEKPKTERRKTERRKPAATKPAVERRKTERRTTKAKTASGTTKAAASTTKTSKAKAAADKTGTSAEPVKKAAARTRKATSTDTESTTTPAPRRRKATAATASDDVVTGDVLDASPADDEPAPERAATAKATKAGAAKTAKAAKAEKASTSKSTKPDDADEDADAAEATSTRRRTATKTSKVSKTKDTEGPKAPRRRTSRSAAPPAVSDDLLDDPIEERTIDNEPIEQVIGAIIDAPTAASAQDAGYLDELADDATPHEDPDVSTDGSVNAEQRSSDDHPHGDPRDLSEIEDLTAAALAALAESGTAGNAAPRKRRFLRVAAPLVGVAVGVAIGIPLGAATKDGAERPTTTVTVTVPPGTPTTSPGEVPTSVPSSDTTAPTVTTTATTAPTTTDPESTAPPSGQVAMRLSGSASRQSALFRLPAGQTTVHYNSTGGTLTVRLLQQSSNGQGDTFTCSGACQKDDIVTKDDGTYYLDVDSSSSNWNVRIGS